MVTRLYLIAFTAATSVLDESIKEDINPKLKTAQNDITALETKNTAQDKSITDGEASAVVHAVAFLKMQE